MKAEVTKSEKASGIKEALEPNTHVLQNALEEIRSALKRVRLEMKSIETPMDMPVAEQMRKLSLGMFTAIESSLLQAERLLSEHAPESEDGKRVSAEGEQMALIDAFAIKFLFRLNMETSLSVVVKNAVVRYACEALADETAYSVVPGSLPVSEQPDSGLEEPPLDNVNAVLQNALTEAGQAMLDDYEDQHGEGFCECTPEHERGTCPACKMRAALLSSSHSNAAGALPVSKDTERLDFLIHWLGLHDDLAGSGIRDWLDEKDAREAIDAAMSKGDSGE